MKCRRIVKPQNTNKSRTFKKYSLLTYSVVFFSSSLDITNKIQTKKKMLNVFSYGMKKGTVTRCKREK